MKTLYVGIKKMGLSDERDDDGKMKTIVAAQVVLQSKEDGFYDLATGKIWETELVNELGFSADERGLGMYLSFYENHLTLSLPVGSEIFLDTSSTGRISSFGPALHGIRIRAASSREEADEWLAKS